MQPLPPSISRTFFIFPNGNFLPIKKYLFVSFSWPLAATFLLCLYSFVYSTWAQLSGTIQHLLFCDRLISLIIMSSRLICVWNVSGFPSFWGWVIFCCIYHLLFAHVSAWRVALLLLFGTYEQYCNEHECTDISETLLLILLDIYPEVRLLDHMVILFLMFLGNTILFSIAAAPFLPYCQWHTSVPHQHFLIMAILIGEKWYHVVILICISLMINYVERFCKLIGLLYIFFGGISVQVLCPFL